MCGSVEIRAALTARLARAAGAGPALIVPELRLGSRDVTYLLLQGPYDPKGPRDQRRRADVVRTKQYPADHKHGYYVEERSANVDLAVVTPLALDLYEIKGESDSLTRLRTQAPAYEDSGSRNSLVVAERHLRRARELVPEHWGIIVATGDPCTLMDERPARPNPNRTKRGLLAPLYSHELKPLASAHGARSRVRSCLQMIEFLEAEQLGLRLEALAAWMRRQLAQRDHDSTFGAFGDGLGKKVLTSTTIGDLGAWPDFPLLPFDPVLAVAPAEAFLR